MRGPCGLPAMVRVRGSGQPLRLSDGSERGWSSPGKISMFALPAPPAGELRLNVLPPCMLPPCRPASLTCDRPPIDLRCYLRDLGEAGSAAQLGSVALPLPDAKVTASVANGPVSACYAPSPLPDAKVTASVANGPVSACYAPYTELGHRARRYGADGRHRPHGGERRRTGVCRRRVGCPAEGLRGEKCRKHATAIVRRPGEAMRQFECLVQEHPDLGWLMRDTADLLGARHFARTLAPLQDAVAEGRPALFVLSPRQDETMITTGHLTFISVTDFCAV